MRMLINGFSKVSLCVIALVFAGIAPIKAQDVITNGDHGNSGMARVIINRAADFGIEQSINLFIDGSKVAILSYNDTYDAPLPPGRHVLLITTDPNNAPRTPEQVVITAKAGETYTFTASWPDPERADLVANDRL